MVTMLAATLSPSSMWCGIEGMPSVVKILVKRPFFFMLRSVYALSLGLFWLPRNIFGLDLLVFDS